MRTTATMMIGFRLPMAMLVAATAQTKLAPAKGAVLEMQSPLGLTTSDGAGLELTSLKARAVVQDPLAFTELHLTFRNPERRIREGRFRIALPAGAVVSRFAMKVGGQWQEGEVVEKQAARRAYEDFLHRRQDPALMENEAGNEFSARIFPIAANAEKELILSYSQELPDSAAPYRLPLLGLPRLGSLDVRVLLATTITDAKNQNASSLGGALVRQESIEIKKTSFRPDQDLVVPARTVASATALRHDNLVVARVRPFANDAAADPVSHLVVLFDTSASRALGFAQSVRRFEQALTAMAKVRDFDVDVLAFDQTVVPMYKGKASGFLNGGAQKLVERRAEGASDLGGALKAVRARFAANTSGKRLLLVTDGVATAGTTASDELRQDVTDLASSSFTRADAMAVGGIRDDDRLRLLTTAGLQQAGVVLNADATIEEAARRLSLATVSNLKVHVPGAAWVWPTQLDGMQPGDEVLVYADLPLAKPLQIEVAGKLLPGKIIVTKTERHLLERAWVKARIARLEHQKVTMAAKDADLQAALTQQIIGLSTKFRVLSDYTALLVLETEADYARFNIDRRALANILTVGSGGIEVQNRSGQNPVLASPELDWAQERKENSDTLRGLGASTKGAPKRHSDSTRGVDSISGLRGGVEAAPGGGRGGGSKGSSAFEGVFGLTGGSAAGQTPSSGRNSREEESERKKVSSAEPRSPQPSRSQAPAARPMPSESATSASESPPAPPSSSRVVSRRPSPQGPTSSGPDPLSGKLADITSMVKRGQGAQALRAARDYRAREPGDVLAIVALGRSLEAVGNKDEAARVYGSMIDLFPGRADLRRFAAGHLESLNTPTALALAVDCLTKAAADRADHPSSHHLQAMALLQAKRPAIAFAAIETALATHYPDGRFAGADRVLQEDLGLCAAAWIRTEPKRRAEILQRLQQAGGAVEDAASVRFVLTWETDANDVDFHIRDGRGGHAFYSEPSLRSGGDLYADVTTGYGPECFTVRGAAAKRAYPYNLSAHYYSKGPMGYGMGRLAVIEHDGAGTIRIESRPFVVMTDGAFLQLGQLTARDR